MDDTIWDPDHDWILQFENLIQSKTFEILEQGTIFSKYLTV